MKFYIRKRTQKKSIPFDLRYYIFNDRSTWNFIQAHITKETFCAGRKTFYLDINL